MQMFMVKLHNIPHQLNQIHVCRRSWRNRIPSLEDYYASLCIVHVKEYKCTLSPLFLGSTVYSKGALDHHTCTCTCTLGIKYDMWLVHLHAVVGWIMNSLVVLYMYM